MTTMELPVDPPAPFAPLWQAIADGHTEICAIDPDGKTVRMGKEDAPGIVVMFDDLHGIGPLSFQNLHLFLGGVIRNFALLSGMTIDPTAIELVTGVAKRGRAAGIIWTTPEMEDLWKAVIFPHISVKV